jgi:hypothetical protein
MNRFTVMPLLTALFVASLLATVSSYFKSAPTLASNDSMQLQITLDADPVEKPGRDANWLRLIDPTRWFDGTPKDRRLRQKYWPQSSWYFVYEFNQAAKVSEYC